MKSLWFSNLFSPTYCKVLTPLTSVFLWSWPLHSGSLICKQKRFCVLEGQEVTTVCAPRKKRHLERSGSLKITSLEMLLTLKVTRFVIFGSLWYLILQTNFCFSKRLENRGIPQLHLLLKGCPPGNWPFWQDLSHSGTWFVLLWCPLHHLQPCQPLLCLYYHLVLDLI